MDLQHPDQGVEGAGTQAQEQTKVPFTVKALVCHVTNRALSRPG